MQASLGWLHTKAVSLQGLGMIFYIIHPLLFRLNQPVSTAYTSTRHAPHCQHIKSKRRALGEC
ncbi:hypothetical protein PSEEN1779 [Pseudomonas entomophila L48]|uniref:Uncharacterized protein n=1 Tax=Pseudomonas entomophila (strain L48) TaxID=384676 RepID=Q1ICJ1_PSEE4|nr:hypothetical protein PSEEN1779 [Pseudomonas entomophila L48]